MWSNFLDGVTTRAAAFCSLQLPQQLTTDAIQHTVAAVESAADERVYELTVSDDLTSR